MLAKKSTIMFNNLFLFVSILFLANCRSDSKPQNISGILFKDSLNTLSIYIPKRFSIVDSIYEKEILGDKFEFFSATFNGDSSKIDEFIKYCNSLIVGVEFNSPVKSLAEIDSLDEHAPTFQVRIKYTLRTKLKSDKKNHFLIKQKFFKSSGEFNIQVVNAYCLHKSDLFFLQSIFYYSNKAKTEKNYKEIIGVLESLEFIN
ncbi:MAG TPA: hypothetical protein PLU85_08670 [Bacteroidia bacterium]|nr:hypothetical protein [Bacteroidia bacterium]HOZ90812.1 hypothetical protein [Bacteroidia bacterium]HRA60320.1 hypothetical protein [Bacteroidia bacterium]HRB26050.1 hypothetical protein [Bacteroidia bacterium]HRB39108.1 hypothetical protein [Bacteroidia bacterium]